MQKSRALMLENKNGIKFFTKKSNYVKLKEFAKKFNIRLYFIETKYEDLSNLNELIKDFCDQNYKTPEIEYKLLSGNLLDKKQVLSKKGLEAKT